MSAAAHRRPEPGLVALAVLAGALVAAGGAAAADGGATPGEVALVAATAAVYVASGVLALWRRPRNAIGLLMVAMGLAIVLSSLVEAREPLLVGAALVGRTLPLAILVHLVLAFPSGRLGSPAERLVAGAGYAVALVLEAPAYLLGRSDDDLLRVAERSGIADAFAVVQAAAGVVVLLAAAVLVERRRRASDTPARRALLPVTVYALAALLVTVLVVVLFDSGAAEGLVLTIGVAEILLLAGLPLVFLASLWEGGFAPVEGARAVLAAPGSDTPSLDALAAAALGDPGARVETGGAGAASGHLAALPLVHDGEALGVLRYDAALVDPETAAEVARLLALVVALRRSRARIVEASDDERRRIARDLHDGAQQRIVVLGLDAQRIARRADDPEAVRAAAAAVVEGLGAILDELRALVHGLMPAPLVERGLPSAARWLADRMPIPVEVRATGLEDRLPSVVESTGYFTVAEALTNTVKYARAREATVVMERSGAMLSVEVRDDGVGGADPSAGTGLRGIRDRVEALGGELAVGAGDGGGTRVTARIPCGS